MKCYDVNTRRKLIPELLANIANFGIMAAYTGTGNYAPDSSPMNFMHNQLVEKSGSDWSYTPVKYWPTTIGDQISFFAYAPHSSDASNVEVNSTKVLVLSANDTPGTPTVTYTVPANPTEMVDFVAGVVMDRKRTTETPEGGTTTTNTVDFVLKHELTRVAFQAKVNKEVYATTGDAHKTKINIKSATFDADAKFYSKGVYTFATVNGERGSWAPTAPATSYSIGDILNYTEDDTDLTPANYYTKGGVKGVVLEGETSVSLFTPVTAAVDPNPAVPSYLFLIPPNGATGLDASNKISVTFEYDIVTVDANLANGHSVTSATKKVYLPAGTLKQGVAYNYTFTFNVDEVVVTAEVDTWGTEGSGGGTIDYGTPDVTTP